MHLGGAGAELDFSSSAPSQERLRVEGWLIFPGPGYVYSWSLLPGVGCWTPGCPSAPLVHCQLPPLHQALSLRLLHPGPTGWQLVHLNPSPVSPGPSLPAQSPPSPSVLISWMDKGVYLPPGLLWMHRFWGWGGGGPVSLSKLPCLPPCGVPSSRGQAGPVTCSETYRTWQRRRAVCDHIT